MRRDEDASIGVFKRGEWLRKLRSFVHQGIGDAVAFVCERNHVGFQRQGTVVW